MKRLRIAHVVAVAAALLVAMLSIPALAEAFASHHSAKLIGYEETPLTLSTAAAGMFTLEINDAEDTITFSLTYSGLEGGNILFAHIHLGRPATTGGVIAFFCGGGGKPACPQNTQAGPVTGTIRAANVQGPANQGIAAGEFAEVVRAIRQGATYANVHTTLAPGGEIRGAIK